MRSGGPRSHCFVTQHRGRSEGDLASRNEFCGVKWSYCQTRYRGGLLLRSVTYSMSVSLDGFIVGPDSGFDWGAPDEGVFRFWIDEIREVGVHLLGRRLYETMLYWRPPTRIHRSTTRAGEWAALEAAPQWCSRGRCRRCRAMPAWPPAAWRRIERLRAEPGNGDIAIGGRDARRRGGRVGSDRRVPGRGLPGAGWQWHSVLSPARAPGGSRSRRDPHL